MVPELVEITEKRAEIEKAASDMIDVANAMQVANQEELNRAAVFIQQISESRKAVHDRFNPIIKKFHEGHKMSLALRNEITHPFDTAEQIAKAKVHKYLTEQEAMRLAQEEKLQEELKDSGLPPPVLPAMPTPDGVHTRRNLKIVVKDIKALCAAIADGTAPPEVVVADTSFIRTLVNRRGIDNLNLPGIEAKYEKGLVVKSK